MAERFWLWCSDRMVDLGAWEASRSSVRWRAYLWCIYRAGHAFGGNGGNA
jgi:hypothetical protein